MAADEIDLGEDDGLVTITMMGATVQLDLWKTNNVLAACHAANKDRDAVAYNDALAKAVEGLGYPPLSHRMAQRFARTIQDRVEALAGKA